MKVLKSGVEVDESKQDKVKGGACCCFCEFGWSSAGISNPATYGDICLCQCSKDNGEPDPGSRDGEMQHYDQYRY
jgi:hypothetical protein